MTGPHSGPGQGRSTKKRLPDVDMGTVLLVLTVIVVILFLTWELWVPHHAGG